MTDRHQIDGRKMSIFVDSYLTKKNNLQETILCQPASLAYVQPCALTR